MVWYGIYNRYDIHVFVTIIVEAPELIDALGLMKKPQQMP